MWFLFVMLLISGCEPSTTNDMTTQTDKHTQTNEVTTQSVTEPTLNPAVESQSKKSEFDQSLSDDNIRSYYGLMWESLSEGVEFSLYFRAIAKRILFNDVYSSIWVEGNEVQSNPVSMIRDSKDKNNKLLGIAFNNSITTKVDQLPKEIVETWFNTIKENNYLYVKSKAGKWYSYKVLDEHLKGDFKILSAVLNSIDEINNTPA